MKNTLRICVRGTRVVLLLALIGLVALSFKGALNVSYLRVVAPEYKLRETGVQISRGALRFIDNWSPQTVAGIQSWNGFRFDFVVWDRAHKYYDSGTLSFSREGVYTGFGFQFINTGDGMYYRTSLTLPLIAFVAIWLLWEVWFWRKQFVMWRTAHRRTHGLCTHCAYKLGSNVCSECGTRN